MVATTASRITTVQWVYVIITLFVTLLLCLVLFFDSVMDASVAIRAFVGGEGLWAKAQKEAVRDLEHYASSRDAADYLAYRRQIEVPLGGRRARLELQKRTPDLAIARAGLRQGHNHPADIEYMIPFFRRFQHSAHLSKVIRHWTAGDRLIAELNKVAEGLHEEITSGRENPAVIRTYLNRVEDINRKVRVEEDLFSSTLADASRWADNVFLLLTYVIALLFVALGVGLSRPIIHRIRHTENALLKAQDELLRAEKLSTLGLVAGTVGHELRNPLGVMSNAVYFLQTTLGDADETIKEYLGILKHEIGEADRIVGDLLNSVRSKPPQREASDVKTLLEQTLAKCQIPANVTLSLEIPETFPPLLVDARQIQQVFRNLISNGAEAMPAGGTLEIRAVANRPEDTISIRVRDTGSGITPEAMARLFQPLFTTKSGGIGLGLMVVKNLVEANGGTVAAQSEVGKGTTFSVTLPASSSPAKEG